MKTKNILYKVCQTLTYRVVDPDPGVMVGSGPESRIWKIEYGLAGLDWTPTYKIFMMPIFSSAYFDHIYNKEILSQIYLPFHDFIMYRKRKK